MIMDYLLILRSHFTSESEAARAKLLAGFAARCAVLPGCMGANAYRDLQEENVFVLTQQWASEASLEAHLHSESFRTVCKAIAEADGEPEIEIHQVVQSVGFSSGA